ncbi:MAG: phenylalanyl-tRNA synthetase beta chain, partial [Acidimicrobiaceae bacterium]
SPPKIASRLTLLGMRPINNVVDVSNYVMLELGQPSHPYDLAKVPGHGLLVRRARAEETITTLDDVERVLTDDDLLICDADGGPSGIAGIMGGASSEIDGDTTDVLVEMAWFQPMPIAKSSRRLGVRSEASARFEKGCDPEVLELAQARFLELLGDAVGSVATGMLDVRGTLPSRDPVRVRTSRVNKVLGTDLDGGAIHDLLAPIGFAATAVGDDNDVAIPSWRFDSSTEIDVVEEVARTYGYAAIGSAMPPSTRFGRLSEHQADRRHVRDVLVGLGLAEALPNPFLAPTDLARAGASLGEGITITNPLIADESVLRTSLLPGLLKTLAYNESHRVLGAELFEIGHIFRRPAMPQPLPDEREHVAAALAGSEAPAAVQLWKAVADAIAVPEWDLRSTVLPGLHPTRSATIIMGGEEIGAVGEVDPGVLSAFGISQRVGWFEISLDRLLAQPHGHREHRPVSKYPSSDIDLALVTPDEVTAATIERALRDAAGLLLAGIELFDVYRGPGIDPDARSLAYRLRMQASDHTLTDGEVAEVRARCIEAAAALGATLR